jgi:hypothetical protein
VASLFFWIEFMVNHSRAIYGLRDSGVSAWVIIGGIIGLVLSAILIRVALEAIIVLFRIGDAVQKISERLGDR